MVFYVDIVPEWDYWITWQLSFSKERSLHPLGVCVASSAFLDEVDLGWELGYFYIMRNTITGNNKDKERNQLKRN